MVDTLSLGRMIKRYRMRAGFTQEELAERAAVSVYTISNLERAVTRKPRQVTVALVTDALRLTDDERRYLLAVTRQTDATGHSGDWHIDLEPTPITSITPTLAQDIRDDEHQTAPLRLLPPRPRRLYGRHRDANILLHVLLAHQHHVVVLSGASGVGKTALAAEVLNQLENDHQASQTYYDGVFSISCAGIRSLRSIGALLVELAKLMSSVSKTVQQATALMNSINTSQSLDDDAAFLAAIDCFQDALADKAVLVLLDDFDPHISWQRITSALTVPCRRPLQFEKSPHFLITTRQSPLSPFTGCHLRLAPLDIWSSLELLMQFIGRILEPNELWAARQICEALGCLPRSIEAIGIQIASGAIIFPTLASHAPLG